MNILHIIPSLEYNGAAAQLELLTRRLSGIHQLRICCLSGDGPGAAKLRGQGQHVECLRWTRTFDPAAWWRLRDLLKSTSPALVHVWGLPALRALALTGRHWLSRTLVSPPLPHAAKQIHRLDRWLLRRVRGVAPWSIAEADVLKQVGLADRQVTIIPPGIEVAQDIANEREFSKDILCVGPLEPRKGFRDAIWGLDMLRTVFETTRLTFVGDGSQRPYLEWFAGCLQMNGQVRFLGWRDDVSDLVSRGHVYWAPAVGGRQALLEAMAAGCPVIAADHPMMREIVMDGETGYLVPTGDKVACCKRTRALFLDGDLARSIGDAARRHVIQHFSADQYAERWGKQYAAAASASLAA